MVFVIFLWKNHKHFFGGDHKHFFWGVGPCAGSWWIKCTSCNTEASENQMQQCQQRPIQVHALSFGHCILWMPCPDRAGWRQCGDAQTWNVWPPRTFGLFVEKWSYQSPLGRYSDPHFEFNYKVTFVWEYNWSPLIYIESVPASFWILRKYWQHFSALQEWARSHPGKNCALPIALYGDDAKFSSTYLDKFTALVLQSPLVWKQGFLHWVNCHLFVSFPQIDKGTCFEKV